MSYDRQKLRDELIRDEGLRLTAYRDTLGHSIEIAHASGKIIDIAKKFCVGRHIVSSIKHGKSWGSVTHGII